MEKEIYIVTDGEYSDYNIRAVFSNAQDAERYRLLTKSDNVEVWELDEFDLNKRSDVLYWYISFSETGDVLIAEQRGVSGDNIFDENYHGQIIITGKLYKHLLNSSRDIDIYLWAKDKESAVKIATERRGILLGSHPEFVDSIRNSKYGNYIKLTSDGIEIEEG
jgi:hypothetical protein